MIRRGIPHAKDNRLLVVPSTVGLSVPRLATDMLIQRGIT